MIENNKSGPAEPPNKSVNIYMTKLKNSEKPENIKIKVLHPENNGIDVVEGNNGISELKAFGAEFNLNDWTYMIKNVLFIKYLDENNIPAARKLARSFYCKIKD